MRGLESNSAPQREREARAGGPHSGARWRSSVLSSGSDLLRAKPARAARYPLAYPPLNSMVSAPKQSVSDCFARFRIFQNGVGGGGSALAVAAPCSRARRRRVRPRLRRRRGPAERAERSGTGKSDAAIVASRRVDFSVSASHHYCRCVFVHV